jgi:hypothetical protein
VILLGGERVLGGLCDRYPCSFILPGARKESSVVDQSVSRFPSAFQGDSPKDLSTLFEREIVDKRVRKM